MGTRRSGGILSRGARILSAVVVLTAAVLVATAGAAHAETGSCSGSFSLDGDVTGQCAFEAFEEDVTAEVVFAQDEDGDITVAGSFATGFVSCETDETVPLNVSGTCTGPTTINGSPAGNVTFTWLNLP